MLKIRLMRIGAKKKPFYRVVVIDERNKRNGAYLELLGTYDPMTTPHEINLKQDNIDEWIKKGAQMSDGFLRIIGKAPQKPPRKPKKEKKEEPSVITSEGQASSPQSSDKEGKPSEDVIEETSTENGITKEQPTEEIKTPQTAEETVKEEKSDS